MPEDKLTRAERIRLESLAMAQSVLNHVATQRPTAEEVFAMAERIESWLKKANGFGDA